MPKPKKIVFVTKPSSKKSIEQVKKSASSEFELLARGLKTELSIAGAKRCN